MSAFATSWVTHLLVGGVQAALLAVLALGLVRIARRSSASWRHALLAIALLKFALPSMIPLPFGVFTAMTPAVRPAFGEVEASMRGGDVALVLMLVHLAGMLMMSIRWGIAARAWRGWVEKSRRDERLTETARALALESGWRQSTPEVRVVASLPVPMASGFRRPVILLSQSFAADADRARVELVLRHELEHLARRDPLWNLAGSMIRILWWWHPLLGLLLREMRRVREERCDDAVVSKSPESARDYAHLLIDLVPRAASVAIPMPACAATGSLFEQRLRRLLDDGAERSASIGRRARAALVVLALVALPGFGYAKLEVIRLPSGAAAPSPNKGHVHGHIHRHHSLAQPTSMPRG